MTITAQCQYMRDRRKQWKEEGLCSECGGQREDKRWRMCKYCRGAVKYRRSRKVNKSE